MSKPVSHALGVVAIECAPGAPEPVAALMQQQAGDLAEAIAHDLANFCPGLQSLDFSLMAAHFDPAEALRPGWPLHRRLEELQARAPRSTGAGRVIAFGCDAAGTLPQPLACDPALRGGAFRILPFLVSGEESAIADAGDILETVLVDRGMASADSALMAQEAFSTRIEHMRYFTLNDLLAMTALQYEHMGLAPLWPLIEAALLQPGTRAELDAPPEPRVRLDTHGEAAIELTPPRDWLVLYAQGETDPDRLQRRMAHHEARQRQFAAVLETHGIPVVFEAVG